MKFLKSLIDLTKLLFKLLILILKNQPVRIKFFEEKLRKAIIIGNGPSLQYDIEEILKLSKNNFDIYTVNYFAKSRYFKEIMPTHYFFSDKMFWTKSIIPEVKSDNQKIFKILREIDWKMTIICPHQGYPFLKNELSENKNLTFYIIPIRSTEFMTDEISFLSIKNRIFSVPNVNSVVSLLWMALNKKYKEILLYGVDFSIFSTITVNQSTNEVIVPTEHFYKNSLAENNAHKKYLKQKSKTISHRFYQVYRSFKLMDTLAKLSIELKVDVVNKSSFSFIDSFPREKNNLDILKE
jgi:hypothetical protein